MKTDFWKCVDYIWDEWELILTGKNKAENVLISKWAGDLLSNKFPKLSAEKVSDIVNKFQWELTYVYRKPIRKMKWLHGEHVFLYDVFGCKEHKVIITAYSDERWNPHETVFCPECNKEHKRKDYPLDWKKCTDDEWKYNLSVSKFVKKEILISNFKYSIKRFPEKVKYSWWKFKRNFKKD